MAGTKLEKINDYLYHEPYKEGTAFAWAKCPSFLLITITNIEVGLGLSMERDETSFLFPPRQNQPGDQPSERDAAAEKPSADATDTERFGWQITATGTLKKRRIGLIQKDGSVTGYGRTFDTVDLILKSGTDEDRAAGTGYIFHNGEDLLKWEKQSDPYLTLELQVPATALKQLCEQLLAGRLTTLELGVRVEVFQSEVDRGLAEPGMTQEYYIEEDTVYNRVYLSWLQGTQSLWKNLPKETAADPRSDEENPPSVATPLKSEPFRVIAQSLDRIRLVGIAVVLVLVLILIFK